jgi:hypothetical protein
MNTNKSPYTDYNHINQPTEFRGLPIQAELGPYIPARLGILKTVLEDSAVIFNDCIVMRFDLLLPDSVDGGCVKDASSLKRFINHISKEVSSIVSERSSSDEVNRLSCVRYAVREASDSYWSRKFNVALMMELETYKSCFLGRTGKPCKAIICKAWGEQLGLNAEALEYSVVFSNQALIRVDLTHGYCGLHQTFYHQLCPLARQIGWRQDRFHDFTFCDGKSVGSGSNYSLVGD